MCRTRDPASRAINRISYSPSSRACDPNPMRLARASVSRSARSSHTSSAATFHSTAMLDADQCSHYGSPPTGTTGLHTPDNLHKYGRQLRDDVLRYDVLRYYMLRYDMHRKTGKQNGVRAAVCRTVA